MFVNIYFQKYNRYFLNILNNFKTTLVWLAEILCYKTIKLQILLCIGYSFLFMFKTLWVQLDQLIDPTYTGRIVVPWLFI